WNSGRVADLDDVLAANFVRHEPQLDGGTTGREDYKQTVHHLRSRLSEFRTESMDAVEQGNKIAFRFRTTGKHNNLAIVFEGVNILHVYNGKILEDWVFYDATGLQQKFARAQAASQ
ncbi:MAG: ester cyclase, partial [Candidatus Acidiferrum sp.]